jgi:hypothetical protein
MDDEGLPYQAPPPPSRVSAASTPPRRSGSGTAAPPAEVNGAESGEDDDDDDDEGAPVPAMTTQAQRMLEDFPHTQYMVDMSVQVPITSRYTIRS